MRDANWGSLGTNTVIGNPWLFAGQEWRGDLSLSNYKARWYQPTLGRFLQNDPIRFDAGDINLYRYCFNDPVNRSDPSGQFAPAIAVAVPAFGLVVAIAYVTASPEGRATAEQAGRAIKSAVDDLGEELEGEFDRILKNRDKKTDRRNSDNPLKNREKAQKERRAKPDDPEEAERVKNENHEIKKSRGQGGRGDATKTDEDLEKALPPTKPKPDNDKSKGPQEK